MFDVQTQVSESHAEPINSAPVAEAVQPVASDADEKNEDVALPLRGDTLLGVCEAVGQDFGFHPNFLRIIFASLIIFSPVLVVSSYLLLGVLVLASRMLFPRPRAADDSKLVETAAAPMAEARLAA